MKWWIYKNKKFGQKILEPLTSSFIYIFYHTGHGLKHMNKQLVVLTDPTLFSKINKTIDVWTLSNLVSNGTQLMVAQNRNVTFHSGES